MIRPCRDKTGHAPLTTCSYSSDKSVDIDLCALLIRCSKIQCLGGHRRGTVNPLTPRRRSQKAQWRYHVKLSNLGEEERGEVFPWRNAGQLIEESKKAYEHPLMVLERVNTTPSQVGPSRRKTQSLSASTNNLHVAYSACLAMASGHQDKASQRGSSSPTRRTMSPRTTSDMGNAGLGW